jgi:hypothetical protein
LGFSQEAAASTEVKSKKARQKNQVTSFYFLGSIASKIVARDGCEWAMRHTAMSQFDHTLAAVLASQ